MHLIHCSFARRDGAAHGVDFVLVLDDASEFGDFLTVEDLDAEAFHRVMTGTLHAVHREAAIVAGAFSHQLVDLFGKVLRVLLDQACAFEKEERSTVADFFYKR